MAVYSNVADTVGNTPLIELSRFASELPFRLLGKMETRNPLGSVKDRIGVAMIRAARESGTLADGARIVEASSGNTGIALASAATALGFSCTIVMPESMSRERVALLKMLGADVVLTRGSLMNDAVRKADEICKADPKAVQMRQFANPSNPRVHYESTGPEIWADTGGVVHCFVAGVGTGGTISGVGRYLKEQSSDVRVIAVEPAASSVLSGGMPGPHYIQGIGAGFVPENFDREVVDEVVTIEEKDALRTAVRLARSEGILAGISSGGNLAAVTSLAQRKELEGKTVVTVLCDTGERYLSTPLADEAMRR